MLAYIFILITMIFFHIIDDYNYQGILANLKQKKWWQENYPDEQYKHDYIVALICHSFKWTFMILLPPTVYAFVTINKNFKTYLGVYLFMFVSNCIFHACVDNLKANKYILNLVQDQLFHLLQIFLICTVLLSTINMLL